MKLARGNFASFLLLTFVPLGYAQSTFDLNAGFGHVLFKCSLKHLATTRLMFAALCVCRLFVRSRKQWPRKRSA